MEKPVPVPGPTVIEYIDVPADLLVMHQKSTIPEAVTYGDVVLLWSLDRATIDILLGQLQAIESL